MARLIAVINTAFDETLREQIRRTAEETGFAVQFYGSEAEAGEALQEAEVIYGVAPKTAQTSDALRWLCLPTAGADLFCRPGMFRHEETLLTNSAGAYGLTLAEHAVMLTLMLLRQMPHFEEGIRQREWRSPVPQRSIKDSRVTLLGAGDIGRNIARRLKPFEPAGITAVNRSGRSTEPAFDVVVPQEKLAEVLPQTDILIMSLPATPATDGILGEEALSLLPEHAYVVNVGRGTAVDEPALIRALNSGAIAGAALDVTRTEPLPENDPLWEAKHLILTPHVAGNMTIAYTRQKNVNMFCEDLRRYAAGEPLQYLVDREAGY